VIDVIVLVLLVEIAGMAVGWAAFLAAGSGAGIAFLLSKFWAFRDPTPIQPKQIGAYAVVSLVTAIFMACSVHFLAVTLRITYLIAKGIASLVVFALWSYPAQARLVFPRARKRARI
jgi:putative flippase GtrA